jgi:hypothetical protein
VGDLRAMAPETDGAGWSGRLLYRPAGGRFFLTAPFIERNRANDQLVDEGFAAGLTVGVYKTKE